MTLQGDDRRQVAVESAGGFRRIMQAPGEPLDFYVRVPHDARLRFTVPPSTRDDAFAVSMAVGPRDAPLDVDRIGGGDREAALDAEEGAIARLRFDNRGTGPLAWWAPRVTGTARVRAPILDPALRPPRRPLNVIVFVADALRADHSSLYGYHRPTTPALERLGAAHGIVFEHAYSTGPSTPNSIPSLFTTLLPSALGIGFRARSSRARRTLAEAFSLAGVQTAAFVGNPLLLEVLGYDRGFGAYEILRAEHPDRRYVSSRALVDRALEYASVNRDAQWFVYLQAMETHTPFSPSPAHRGRFSGDGLTALPFPRRAPDVALPIGTATPQPPPMAPSENVPPPDAMDPNRYDEAIATVDEQIDRLVHGLEQLGVADRTMVVVTADHGEGLGNEDDGRCLHGYALFEELVHVPLVLWLPWIEGGRRETAVVSLAALGPTLLDLAGIAIPESFVETSLLQPRTGIDPPEALLERLALHWTEQDLRGSGVYAVDEWAIRQGPWKLIMDAERIRLFHLPSDPKEVVDRRDAHPEVAGYLVGRLARLSPGLSPHPEVARTVEPDEGTKRELTEALKALGYLGD